ncbi:nuclear transport factor 2 family protein [Piscinibacter sp.]|uniref:nuclear transport factor 2 family protein n=1 Tax=Piscinibacter sp. TaxID=1903157 RepID=UPI002C17B4AC|nr:nuclear transport factor 2 family protein [Albitalea sp.]HUG26295.1 nuclear transport factor 2 family protein [Albitalea sp.]
MQPMERLLAQESCRELVLQAAARVDAGDATGFADLFLANGVLVRPNTQPLHGRDAIRDTYSKRPANRMTRHLVTNVLVDVQSSVQARVLSYVTLWVGSTDDAPGPHGRPAQGPRVVGEFEDLLSLSSEGWRIARREARFLLHTP